MKTFMIFHLLPFLKLKCIILGMLNCVLLSQLNVQSHPVVGLPEDCQYFHLEVCCDQHLNVNGGLFKHLFRQTGPECFYGDVILISFFILL